MEAYKSGAYQALMIGEKAPHFEANSTYGAIRFPEDYKGKWVVFFSHPGDFTPVCTTEIMTFASRNGEFETHNCRLLGLSVDSNPSHIDWVKSMEGYTWKNIKNPRTPFPIIADDFGGIARQYGMLMPTSSTSKTVRAVFMIDPEGTVRAILNYPLTTGRNISEILRLLLALQAYDETGNPTPCDWQPGEPQVLPPVQTLPEAEQRSGGHGPQGASCLDWYLCFTSGSNTGGANGMAANHAGMPAPAAMPMRQASQLPGIPEIKAPVYETPKPNNGMLPDMMPAPMPFTLPKPRPMRMAESMPGRATANSNALSNMLSNTLSTPNPAMTPNVPKVTPPLPELSVQTSATPAASPAPVATAPAPTLPNRLFTTAELQSYDGKSGKPAYAVVDGVVYDLSPVLKVPSHADLAAGSDLSDEFHGCHGGREHLLNVLPVMGFLRDGGRLNRPLGPAEPTMARPRQHSTPDSVQGRRSFTLHELTNYNGRGGRPAYGAVNGVVYDLKFILGSDAHAVLKPGTDMTREFSKCHMGMNYLLNNLPVVGKLK